MMLSKAFRIQLFFFTSSRKFCAFKCYNYYPIYLYSIRGFIFLYSVRNFIFTLKVFRFLCPTNTFSFFLLLTLPFSPIFPLLNLFSPSPCLLLPSSHLISFYPLYSLTSILHPHLTSFLSSSPHSLIFLISYSHHLSGPLQSKISTQ